MHFYPNERLALFIDGANLYATAKALGFDIDYKRLLALFRFFFFNDTATSEMYTLSLHDALPICAQA